MFLIGSTATSAGDVGGAYRRHERRHGQADLVERDRPRRVHHDYRDYQPSSSAARSARSPRTGPRPRTLRASRSSPTRLEAFLSLPRRSKSPSTLDPIASDLCILTTGIRAEACMAQVRLVVKHPNRPAWRTSALTRDTRGSGRRCARRDSNPDLRLISVVGKVDGAGLPGAHQHHLARLISGSRRADLVTARSERENRTDRDGPCIA